MATVQNYASGQATAPQPRFSFSTDMVPEHDRVGFFREELARLLRLEIKLLDKSPPKYAIETIAAGPVGLNIVHAAATRFSRTKQQLADADNDFLFILHTGGRQEIEHNGRTTSLGPGDACLVQNGSTGWTTFPERASTLALRIDGTALRAMVRYPETLAGELIQGGRPGVSLLRRYLRSLAEEKDLTPELLHTLGLHVIDLVASILGATRDASAQAEAGGIRAARLRSVMDNIAMRACDPHFSIETVAAQLAVTSRTLQLLLEETGSTFSEHVTEHRLRRAWRLLAVPTSRLAIAEVAQEAGFNDLSHFYRAFRRRYGETPASVRAGSQRVH